MSGHAAHLLVDVIVPCASSKRLQLLLEIGSLLPLKPGGTHRERYKWDDSAPPGLANTITVPRSRNLPPLYVVVKPAALKKSLFATDAPMELSGEVNVPKTAIYISTSSTLDESHQTMLQQLLGLSPRESHLAIGLANGMSLDEIADESGVKRSTVRSQLRSLFQKTGVNQQSALVSMVLRSLVGLG